MPTPALLFVHGSWHGPWCWERVTAALAADFPAIRHAAVALPSCGTDLAGLGTLDDDGAAIAAAARALGGPVTVVAHSYGGVALTGAALGPEVVHLAYLGAFMPATGRSLASYLPPGPLPPYVTIGADGIGRSVPEAVGEFLYGDCTPADVAWAMARLVPQNGAVVTTPVGPAAWERIPSTYLLLTEDRAVPVPLQRAFAAQAGRTVEMAASHSPFLSKPAALAGLLAGIAAAAPAAAPAAAAAAAAAPA